MILNLFGVKCGVCQWKSPRYLALNSASRGNHAPRDVCLQVPSTTPELLSAMRNGSIDEIGRSGESMRACSSFGYSRSSNYESNIGSLVIALEQHMPILFGKKVNFSATAASLPSAISLNLGESQSVTIPFQSPASHCHYTRSYLDPVLPMYQ